MPRFPRLTGKNGDLVRRTLVSGGLAVAYTDGTSTYLSLPGLAGNYASAPDAAPLDIISDIDIRIAAALTDWTGTADQALIAKNLATGNQRSWLLRVIATTGVLRLFWSLDGTSVAAVDIQSTAAPVVADGGLIAIRATLDADNGAAGNTVTFYTRPTTLVTTMSDLRSHTGWTQLGDPVITATATSIFNSTANLNIGAHSNGASLRAAGKYAGAVIFAGIGGAGTKAFDIDFTAGPMGAANLKEAANAATVTISTSGGGPFAVIVEGAI